MDFTTCFCCFILFPWYDDVAPPRVVVRHGVLHHGGLRTHVFGLWEQLSEGEGPSLLRTGIYITVTLVAFKKATTTIHCERVFKSRKWSQTLWGVFKVVESPRVLLLSNKLEWVCIINIKGCVCVWEREGPLTLCKKELAWWLAGVGSFGVAQVAWCIFFRSRPWGTMTTTTKTKLTALKATRIQKLGCESELASEKAGCLILLLSAGTHKVVMHFSVYFCALYIVYPTMNEGHTAKARFNTFTFVLY